MPIANPIISAQTKRFADLFNYGSLDEPTLFERYFIYSVLNGKEGLNASEEDFHLPGTEFGIDGVGLVINGVTCTDPTEIDLIKKISNSDLYFFQAKTSSGLNYGKLSTFFDGAYQFVVNDFHDPSDDLKNATNVFQNLLKNAHKFSENPSLNLYFGYTGTGDLSPQIQKLVNDTKKRFNDLSLFSSVEIFFVGASPLQDMFRRASEASEAKFVFAHKATLPEHPKVSESYLGFIPASELIKIISSDHEQTKINKKLFFDNVRDFNPESDVNKSIEESISDDSSGFVFRNNGITIVARDGRPTGNSFFIKDFQIVNGCQTSNIIFRNKESVEKVHIPMRLIISDDNDFINTIIVGTNKQNHVRDEQFWALRPFAKDFEEYVRAQGETRSLFYERRENQYRFDDVPERTRIVDSSTVVKSVVAMFMNLPNRAGRDYRQMKTEFSDRIFLDGHDVRVYHAAAYAFYRLEFLYRTNRISKTFKKYRMYILWSVSKVFFLEGEDVFSMNGDKVERQIESLLDFLDNEVAFVDHVTRFIHNYESALESKGQSSDRDALRSEDAMLTAREALEKTLNA